MIRKVCAFMLFLFLILSCVNENNVIGRGDGFKYARNISIDMVGNFRVATLVSPWDSSKVLHRYVLVERKDSAISSDLPDGTALYIPFDRAVVFSSPHVSLAFSLGAGNRIAGIADKEYIVSPVVKTGIDRLKVMDCGASLSPDVEKIISLTPDAIFVTPYENSGGYGIIEEAGAPIVECADYMETSALGRAEWMRFYGILFGKEREADSLFSNVESEYQRLSEQARAASSHPSVITERVMGGTWYVPGGNSSLAHAIIDAGGSYPFSSDTHGGSLPKSVEEVLDKAGESDVWLFNVMDDDISYESIGSENDAYRMMRAWRERNIWTVNTLSVPYFDDISFRPDLLLRDLVAIVHPELGNGKTIYYRKVTK